MKKSELLKLVESIDDEGSVDEVLSQSDLIKSLVQSGLTLDAFKGKMKEKDFKAYIDSLNDKHFDKALETWKTNNLEKELEPFIRKKYPDLAINSEDKAMKRVKELEAQMARKDLLTQAIQYASEKGIPANLSNIVEKLLCEDLETTKTELDSFVEVVDSLANSKVDKRLGSSSWIPGSNTGGSTKGIEEIIAERHKNSQKVEGPNPWA